MSGLVDWTIVGPARAAGLIILSTHVPLGQEVLKRGIIFIDLAIAQVAGLGVIAAHSLNWDPNGFEVQLAAVGALVLYLFMRWQGGRLPGDLGWWGRFVLLSLCGNLLPFTLITWAETRISSGQAGLLMALMPLSTVLLAHFYVAHEQLTTRKLFGVVVGFLGVTILVGTDVLSGLGGGQLLAQFAVLAATLSYAVNSVYTKRLPPVDTLVVAAGSLLAGALVLLPLVLVVDRPWTLEPGLDAWVASISLGVFATGLATWVYFSR